MTHEQAATKRKLLIFFIFLKKSHFLPYISKTTEDIKIVHIAKKIALEKLNNFAYKKNLANFNTFPTIPS